MNPYQRRFDLIMSDLLIQYDYHIIAEVDVQHTFCEDGIIVASSPLIDPIRFELPKRK